MGMMFSRTVGADKLANQRGFTLIELSIVLAIIGLLVGGVLKGQEMVNGARLKTTVAQVQAYRAAVNAFQDKYEALPGDYTLAATNILGTLRVGDGNGVIGAVAAIPTWTNDNNTREESVFWQQLAAANLITGVQGLSTAAGVGNSYPAANVSGAGWDLQNSASFPASGTYFFVLNSNVGGAIVMSGRDAWTIDMKYDDGVPGTGSIVTNETGCITAPNYQMLVTTVGCHLAFAVF
jgi:prepilin-type N-terminal cleavage/methylation domain-containing protein